MLTSRDNVCVLLGELFLRTISEILWCFLAIELKEEGQFLLCRVATLRRTRRGSGLGSHMAGMRCAKPSGGPSYLMFTVYMIIVLGEDISLHTGRLPWLLRF